MKRISVKKIEDGYFYLACVPHFSESGWEVCSCDNERLISQGNGDDITDMASIVYQLPD